MHRFFCREQLFSLDASEIEFGLLFKVSFVQAQRTWQSNADNNVAIQYFLTI